MPSTQLRTIQRRVLRTREMLTVPSQQMQISGKVLESLRQLAEWYELNTLANALWCHNNPSADYHLPMHQNSFSATISSQSGGLYTQVKSLQSCSNRIATFGYVSIPKVSRENFTIFQSFQSFSSRLFYTSYDCSPMFQTTKERFYPKNVYCLRSFGRAKLRFDLRKKVTTFSQVFCVTRLPNLQ